MKFLCPNCKAKYQIADEKIGGRTLKMDCRKCGHLIVLRSEGATTQSLTGAESVNGSMSSRPPANSAASISGGSIPSSSMSGGAVPAALVSSGSRSWPAASTGSSLTGGSRPMPPQPRLTARSTSGSQVGQNPALASRIPPRPGVRSMPPQRPLEQWHVAINDVPVGPMKRDEIARKIAQGAVTADSLAWREGFGDWKPVREIPELSALLKEGGLRSSLPPPTPSSRSSSDSIPRAPASGSGSSASVHGSRLPSVRPAPSAAAARLHDDIDEPTMMSGMNFGANALAPFSEAPPSPAAVPPLLDDDGLPPLVTSTPPAARMVSGEIDLRTATSQSLDALITPLGDTGTSLNGSAAPLTGTPLTGSSIGSASTGASKTSYSPPAPSAKAASKSSQQSAKKGMPMPQLFALVGVGVFVAVFAIVFAIKAADKFLNGSAQPTQAAAQAQPAPTPVAAPTPAVAAEPVQRQAELELEAVPTAPVAAEAAATPTQGNGARRGGARTSPAVAAAQPTAAPVPTPANPMFDRFRDQGGGGPARLSTAVADHSADNGARAGSELTDDQIATVVRREQRGLQQCYQLELRRAGGAQETIRVNVTIGIGASGAVTSARAQGPSMGNLSDCLERSVRRWRFPASAGGGEASFPLVFQPGA